MVTVIVEVVEVTVVKFAERAATTCKPADAKTLTRPAVADKNRVTLGATVTAVFLMTALPAI
jgi:hypothetical protein